MYPRGPCFSEAWQISTAIISALWLSGARLPGRPFLKTFFNFKRIGYRALCWTNVGKADFFSFLRREHWYRRVPSRLFYAQFRYLSLQRFHTARWVQSLTRFWSRSYKTKHRNDLWQKNGNTQEGRIFQLSVCMSPKFWDFLLLVSCVLSRHWWTMLVFV